MLGLGLALSIGKRVLGDAIDSLLSALRGRATYYENGSASKSTIKAIDNADILDKATILLTPTATSDARVHSVKTYTGDELVTNGTFDTDSDWSLTRATISGGTANLSTTDGSLTSIVQSVTTEGNRYYFSIEVSDLVGELEFAAVGGLGVYSTITSNGTHTGYFTSAHASIEIKRKFGITNVSATIDNVSVTEADADFDFDRASSATRINSDGLVQDMQSITDPELVLNGDFEELGDDLTSPVNFLSWLQSSVDSRTANTFTVGGSGRGLYFILPENKTLKINVSGLTGSVEIRYRTTTGGAGTVLGSSDTDLYVTTTNATSNIYLRATDEGTVSVTDVSVKQVDPNDYWTLGTGWSIEDGNASCDGTDGVNLSQNGVIQNSKTYKITFDVDLTSGTLFLRVGLSYITDLTITTSGSYEATVVSDGTNLIFRSGVFVGSIDNISVKDITFSTDVDLARINYDSNGENGHILLEPTSTNLVTYSEDFSSWASSNATLESGFLAPDGSNSAYKVSGTVGSTTVYFSGVPNLSSTSTRTIWARTVSGTGTVNLCSYGDNSNNNFTITEEWQRFEVNGTTTSTGESNFYAADFRFNQPNALTEIVIWGAQAENLSYATSYIPTYGSTVTRATETLTGSGNSTLINSTEGVLYAEVAGLVNTDSIDRIISLSDNTTTNRVEMKLSSSGSIKGRFDSAASDIEFGKTGLTVSNFNKIALVWLSGKCALFINGVKEQEDLTFSTFASDVLFDLSFKSPYNDADGSRDFYGKVKALAVFNEALSDTELQNLTS